MKGVLYDKNILLFRRKQFSMKSSKLENSFFMSLISPTARPWPRPLFDLDNKQFLGFFLSASERSRFASGPDVILNPLALEDFPFFTASAQTSFTGTSWLCIPYFELLEISSKLVRRDDLQKILQTKIFRHLDRPEPTFN